MKTDQQHPPFSAEMLAADYVLLGRGGTFKVPVRGYFEGFYMIPSCDGWEYESHLAGTESVYLYAAPRSSEVARINGLSHPQCDMCGECSSPLHASSTEFDSRCVDCVEIFDNEPVAPPDYTLNELARLREENERLKGELADAKDKWSSDKKIIRGLYSMLYEHGIDCGSKAVCDAMRDLRQKDEANRELRAEVERLGNQLTDGVQLNKKHCDEKWELREALEKIAVQRLTDEMDEEMQDSADYEYAYNEITKSARETLAKFQKP